MKSLRFSYLFASVAALSAFASPASSATYTFTFTELIGGDMPVGTDLATLTFEDLSTDLVKITLSHNATSASGQFISDFWFNLDPYVNVTQADLTCNDGTAVEFDTFNAAMDGHANLGMLFDLHQTFKTSGDDRLLPGEWISFTLAGTGLDAADFLAFAQPTDGAPHNVLALIHIQQIPGADSGKMAVVPEPASLAVIGLALAALLRRRRTAR